MDDHQPEPNEWVRPVSLVVTITLGVWCFSGWIIDKGWTAPGVLVAWLTAVLQVVGFNASAQMRRADNKGLGRPAFYWKYVLFVTAGWTAFSAHHGYIVMAGPVNGVEWSLGGVLAFIEGTAALVLLCAVATFEPLLGWGIEAVERGKVPDQDERPDQTNVVGIRHPQPAPAPSTNPIGRAVATATIAATALVGANQTIKDRDQQPAVLVGEPPGAWSLGGLTLVEKVQKMAAPVAQGGEGLSERRIVMAIGRGLTRHEVRAILGRNQKRIA